MALTIGRNSDNGLALRLRRGCLVLAATPNDASDAFQEQSAPRSHRRQPPDPANPVVRAGAIAAAVALLTAEEAADLAGASSRHRDSFVIEHGNEFEASTHALHHGTPGRQQVVIRGLHGRDRRLRTLEPFRHDLGQRTMTSKLGEVERHGVSASFFLDRVDTSSAFIVDVGVRGVPPRRSRHPARERSASRTSRQTDQCR